MATLTSTRIDVDTLVLEPAGSYQSSPIYSTMWERRARQHTTAIPTLAMPPIARRTQGSPLPSGPYLPSVRVLVPREAGLPSRAILIAVAETPRIQSTVHTRPTKRGSIGIGKHGQRGRHGVIHNRDELEPKWLRNNPISGIRYPKNTYLKNENNYLVL